MSLASNPVTSIQNNWLGQLQKPPMMTATTINSIVCHNGQSDAALAGKGPGMIGGGPDSGDDIRQS